MGAQCHVMEMLLNLYTWGYMFTYVRLFVCTLLRYGLHHYIDPERVILYSLAASTHVFASLLQMCCVCLSLQSQLHAVNHTLMLALT